MCTCTHNTLPSFAPQFNTSPITSDSYKNVTAFVIYKENVVIHLIKLDTFKNNQFL